MIMKKQIHDRKSIRLKGYDYTRSGAYFITICTHQMQCLFGEIRNGRMILNEFGTIAHEQWLQLPLRFPSVTLDEFIVMPNHIHGILVLHKPETDPTITVRATLAVAPKTDPSLGGTSLGATARFAPPDAVTVGNVVGAYKSLVATQCLNYVKTHEPETQLGKLWQRNYWDHILHDNDRYICTIHYIRNNPANWGKRKNKGK